jgi:L-malate glycosyltransferase
MHPGTASYKDLKHPKVLCIARLDGVVSHRIEAMLFEKLYKKGVDLHLVTNKESEHALHLKNIGINIFYNHPGIKISPVHISWLRRLIKNEKYDILHLFNSRAISNAVIASLGLDVKVLTYRGSGDLYWTDPTAYLTHLHPGVDAISCVSEYVKQQVDAQFIGRRKKTSVQYKAIIPEWFEGIKKGDLSEFGIPDNAITVTCAANYRKVKGIEYLIRATNYLAEHKDFHLLLIGNGLDNSAVMKLVEASPMKERIHFAGFRDDIFELVLASDIYVQPSLKEGLSRTVLEAMAQQVAVVVTNAGGLPELVENEKSGLLVPAKDPYELAKAISKLINNPQLRKQLGQKAKDDLLSKFSISNYVNGIFELYMELLNDKNKQSMPDQ